MALAAAATALAAPAAAPVEEAAVAEPPSAVASNGFATGPLVDLIEEGARKRLCGGKVLLRLRLACDEVAWVTEPSPLFRMAPRLAYLPFLFNDVYEHFKSYVPPLLGQSYEIWFDYNGIALRWHYPLGVLCDALLGLEVPVPLDLTVHFRGCTCKDLLPFSGIGDLKSAVMSAFRQAVFLQQGSAQAWSRMPMQQQQRLWDAIKAADFEACGQVERQLLCPSFAKCKKLAVRLHICGPGREHRVLLHPAPALEESGAGGPLTLNTLLKQTLPLLFAEAGGEQSAEPLLHGVQVLTQGLRLPLDTPLYWLALHASYLDHFVHLVVRLPP